MVLENHINNNYNGGTGMAGQNVLNGDLSILDQIVSDLSEHKGKKEELEKLKDTGKELSKSIETLQKSISDEIDSKTKEGIESVSKGFDKSISEEKAKLKDVQAKRDKAKNAGVKERIANETADLKDANAGLQSQINAAFKEEKIPKFCSKRLFYAMFQTQTFGDVLIYLLSIIVLYAAIPVVLYKIPAIPDWVLIVYYFVVITVELTVMKIVYDKTVVPHGDTIAKARRVKYDIETNRKKMKRTEKSIRKDKNEEMYGLSDFDYRINEINDSIRNIEDSKTKAIEQFNATTKADIIAEVQGRNEENLTSLKSQLASCESQQSELDTLIKEQRAYISSNYEAYLGKEFTNVDKLVELSDYMREDSSLTISQAIAKYKNNK
jgi:hypothetical protein